MSIFKVSYGNDQVKDFGENEQAAREFVKENGGVVFEINDSHIFGLADRQGLLPQTYEANNKFHSG